MARWIDSLSLTTAGSVDDGKSTLIGRLLLDSGALPDDQRPETGVSGEETPLAWLTDGLKAERAQGITIDVAYRYFRTPRRRFVIADAPGHFEYTRNMVTAASVCDVALILVDARNGLTEQTHRHAFLSSLLGLKRVVLCVNKMDLVDWQAEVFEAIDGGFAALSERLDFQHTHAVPISALKGDNIVRGSDNMPWYRGPPLLTYLEDVSAREPVDSTVARFPVQRIHRGPKDTDGSYYAAGRVAGGTFRPGQAIAVLPGGQTSRIRHLRTMDHTLEHAVAGQSIAMALEDDVEVARGDLIASVDQRPNVSAEVEAVVCWMSSTRPLEPSKTYELRQSTRAVPAVVESVHHKIDIGTFDRVPAGGPLDVNEIARVSIRAGAALVTDPYRVNRTTGSFILIDPMSHETVAAGMIQ